MKALKNFCSLVFVMLLVCGAACAENFVPEQPLMYADELRPGMTGYALTVLRGTEPEKMPVKIVSVIPQRASAVMTEKILIKFTGKHRLAQGMSGSPVFVKNKLVGAIRSGWDNSDQSFAIVTPIEAMLRIFNGEELGVRGEELKKLNVSVTGLGANSLPRLSKALGLNVTQGVASGAGSLEVRNENFRPGEAVAALLAWGDVEISASGTITATAKDGKFLAFGHDFLNRGRTVYPAAKVFVHETVDSYSFPFKIASPVSINGIITQDREAAIGGRAGVFPPSFSAELNFKNLDTNRQNRYSFRVVADEFLTANLIEEIYKGLIAEAWGRKGQGTMDVSLRIEGRNIRNGFARRDIFFSDEDIVEEAFGDTAEMIGMYLTQPFTETMPSGFVLNVEATERPKVLRIEDVETVAKAKPGDEIDVKIKLREWRAGTTEKVVKMKIPERASGSLTLIVRGGNVEPMTQLAIEDGSKSVDSLERMLTELKAADAGNELIIELNGDLVGEVLKKVLNDDEAKNEASEPESEFLSEMKERRIDEGTLKIFGTDFFVDGMMRRVIDVEK